MAAPEAPKKKTEMIGIPTNDATLLQFMGILALRKAAGEISQEEIDREMAVVRHHQAKNFRSGNR